MSLPEPLTGLVGRARELASLRALLVDEGARLVTLTGPGGIGKTRLALAAASELQAAFANRADFVDLSAVADARHVPTAIANALGVSDLGTRPLLETLASALCDRQQILVLDNFERVLGAADAVAGLISACPGLVCIVTSRAPLHVLVEREFPVTALPPDESLALFAARARSARAAFALSDANASAVADICARLDGIPLAIELAAARIKVLSAAQIAERLRDRFRLLTTGDADAPARHRTLRAALDWSFDLLAEPERALLRRMGVFAGSASIDALERVCGGGCVDSTQVLDCLAVLVDQSLVSVVEDHCVARYYLLDTVRDYALQRLGEADEDCTVRALHAAWSVAFVEAVEPDVRGPHQLGALDKLERDHDNLRAALAWSLKADSSDTALRLAGGLWKFWEVRGHAGEGERWLDAVLELETDDPRARTRVLHGAANLAFVRGDYERAGALHTANLELFAQLNDPLGRGITVFHLASVYRCRGEIDRAIALCEESLALFRSLSDRQWCANTLNSLGFMLRDRGAFARGRAALEEALGLYRALGGTRRIAIALLNLGDLARGEGDFARAEAQLCQSLELFAQVQDAWCSGVALENLALLAAARNQAERAATLFGAAEAQRAEAGAALPPVDQPEHDQALAAVMLRIGRGPALLALERGRGLGRCEALDLARSPAIRHLSIVRSPLTEREREVAALVASGLTNKQIADELVITKQTADKHVANILGKLGVATRSQVAVWWVQQPPAAAA